MHLLIDRVSRGGNFLLNVGPAADGTIPVLQQQRLRDIGAWLNVNGEAIYGSRAVRGFPDAPRLVERDSTMFLTRKQDVLYVIATRWPERAITLEGIRPATGAKIRLLGTNAPVAQRRRGNRLSLLPPSCCPKPVQGAAAYVFKIPTRRAAP